MLLLAFALSAAIVSCANGQLVSAKCEDTSTTGTFNMVFKYDRDGTTTATGIISYVASENPNFVTTVSDSGCTTGTLSNDIYTIEYNVVVGQTLPCGVQQDGTDTSVYKFAISPIGIEKVYTFQCDVDNLQIPVVVEVNNFYTEHLDKTAELGWMPDVNFNIFLADQANAPDDEVPIGQPVILRVTYDKGFFDQKPNLCGKSFHLSSTRATLNQIQMFTKGLGTRVKITGTATDLTQIVKRDNPAVFDVPNPSSYIPTGTASAWTIHEGFKIEGIDDQICVRLKTSTPRTVYTVFPDDVLGTSYRAVDFMSRGSTAKEYFITSTKDGTVVTLDLTACTFTGLTIDGNIASATTETVTLNALKSLHIVCDDCSCMTITSTEKIAVVNFDTIPDGTGALAAGTSTNQLPPTTYLDTEFVLTPSTTAYENTAILAADSLTGTRTFSTTTTSGGSFTNENELVESGERLSVNSGVYAFQIMTEPQCSSPAVLLPGRRQWSTVYDFHAFIDTSGEKLYVNIIIEAGQIGNIFIKDGTTDAVISATQNGGTILKLGSHTSEADYEAYTFEITTNGFYTVYTKDLTKSFLLKLTEVLESGAIDLCYSYLSFGTTFRDIFPCVPSTSSFPGNKNDDDCDTFLDEVGVLGGIGEDTALDLNFANRYVLKVKTLVVSDNSGFTGSNVVTVHNDGCNVLNGGDGLASIGAFKKNTALNNVYNDLWVMDTPIFRAGRFISTDDVYFRITVEHCLPSSLDDCSNSCGVTTDKRKKRSTNNKEHTVDFKLKVTGADLSNQQEARAWRCTAAKIYWIPHVLLLLIILIEVTATSYLLYVKYKLKME